MKSVKEFIKIEGGVYHMSNGIFKIAPFEISKYPVTNQWFKEFVDDNGYKKFYLWSDKGNKWLKDYEIKIKWNRLNYPVVGVVSWYEAEAFCKWLTISKDDGYIYQPPNKNQREIEAARFKNSHNWVIPAFSIDNVGFRCVRTKN